MNNTYEQLLNQIFTDFVLLDSGKDTLSKYLSTIKIEEKAKLTHLFLIKELAKTKIQSGVLDSTTMTSLITDVSNILSLPNSISLQSTSQSNRIKSFNDIQTDNCYSFDEEMIKANYIYCTSLIYVDSFKDFSMKSKGIFSDAIDKPKMFQTQYNLLKYFLLENQHYTSLFQHKKDAMEITPLGSLQGTTKEVLVFGMILTNEAGKMQLQDTMTIITVDKDNVETWGRGYFTPGSCVLCQGVYKNNVLKAKIIMHPPQCWNPKNFEEKYEKDYFGAITKAFKYGNDEKEMINSIKSNSNTGGNSNSNSNSNKLKKKVNMKVEELFLNNFLNQDISERKFLQPKVINQQLDMKKFFEKMINSQYDPQIIDSIHHEIEELLQEDFMLIISNVDLTNQNVMKALEKIIMSYTSTISNQIKFPFMIILMGNFIPEQSFNSFKILTQAFEALSNIFLKNTELTQNTYIVFMPGPDDFSLFDGFPKHSLVDSLINPFKKKIPNVINATNPCRFSLFGKETVLFRDDLHKKLSRNSLKECEDMTLLNEYYIQTVLSQGNLAPLPQNISPRIWHLSQAMTILPLPEILILADVIDYCKYDGSDILVVNPGNFSKDYSFVQVFPVKKYALSVVVDIK